MTGKTHIALGLMTALYTIKIMEPQTIITYPGLLLKNDLAIGVVVQLLAVVTAVWLGSLAPDLDQPGSTLSRDIGGPMGTTKVGALVGGLGLLYLASHLPKILIPVPYIQVGFVIVGCILLMMGPLKHRGLTHSLLGMGMAGAAVYWGLLTLLEKGVAFAPSLLIPFLIGYGVHLVADSFTIGGVAPLYIPFIEVSQKHWHWPMHVSTGAFMDTVVLRLGAMVIIVVSFIH